MKSLTKKIVLILIFIYLITSCSNTEKIITRTLKCELSNTNDFNKKKTDNYYSHLISYTKNQTERLFIVVGTSEFEVNLPPEEYTGDKDLWFDYIAEDSITLEGSHNNLYWKQIKFYKDSKPSIGYEGIPKEKVPEFENYLKTFTCKKR